jgi:dihydrofolate reductase
MGVLHKPVFVVTHHPRERGDARRDDVRDRRRRSGSRASASRGREKNVAIAGGASVVQQCLATGLLDELSLHIVPVLRDSRLAGDARGYRVLRVQ